MLAICRSLLKEFLSGRSGMSSVEYVLILALIAGGTMAGVIALNEAVSDRMQSSAACIVSNDPQSDCN